MKRPLASIFVLILVIGGIVLFVTLIVVRLYNELSALSLTMPDYSYFMSLLNQLISKVEKFVVINPQIQAALNSSVSTILQSLQNWAASSSLALLNFLAAIPGFFIILAITIVATYMMSASFPRVDLGVTIDRKSVCFYDWFHLRIFRPLTDCRNRYDFCSMGYRIALHGSSSRGR